MLKCTILDFWQGSEYATVIYKFKYKFEFSYFQDHI